MARKTHVILVDDVDGSEASQTIGFSLEGVSYEIDLNDEHAAELRSAFEQWTDAARRVGGRRATSGRRSGGAARRSTDNDELRAWARENGYDVKDRGRVPAQVREAYEASKR